jgi:glycosyltransferase involved in cell wall biosynthesis
VPKVDCVALYVPALVGGGAERVAAVLASGLAGTGRQVTLVVDFEARENSDLVDPRVELVTLGGGHLASTFRLARLLRERRFAVALAIGTSADVKLVAAQALARADTRLVLSYHGTSSVGRGWLGWSAYPLAPLLTRCAARTVCVSDYLVRHLTMDWRAASGRIVRIYNPVPIDRARPPASAAELAARPATVIALGRLAPEKGFATLLDAFALLRRPDAQLKIYGDGPDRERLQQQVERFGLAGRIDFAGYVTDPWNTYSEASCFALTSRSEGFGNVVVEALASGLPVVSTDCGGPVEILDHGRFGEIVPVGQPEPLAAAIERTLDHRGEPGPRIARAREFAAQAIIAHYAALLEDVLADAA